MRINLSHLERLPRNRPPSMFRPLRAYSGPPLGTTNSTAESQARIRGGRTAGTPHSTAIAQLDHQGDQVSVRYEVAACVCLFRDPQVGAPEAVVLADSLHVLESE